MIVYINRRFVSEEEAVVSVFDRAFLYGDALFETIRIHEGRPFRWDQHLERFQRGAEHLRLRCPVRVEELRTAVTALVKRNGLSDGVLRLTLSRGVGKRGYSAIGADHPVVVMSVHPPSLPASDGLPRWKLVASKIPIWSADPLRALKTGNKLTEVLARTEAREQGADDALLLNEHGEMAESTSANVFWIRNGKVHTPPLYSGALGGVTRTVVMGLCARMGITCEETRAGPDTLHETDGVFVTLSSMGIAEASHLDGRPLRASPIAADLWKDYTRDLLGTD